MKNIETLRWNEDHLEMIDQEGLVSEESIAHLNIFIESIDILEVESLLNQKILQFLKL